MDVLSRPIDKFWRRSTAAGPCPLFKRPAAHPGGKGLPQQPSSVDEWAFRGAGREGFGCADDEGKCSGKVLEIRLRWGTRMTNDRANSSRIETGDKDSDARTPPSGLLKTVLGYARKNIPAFPCDGGKRPLTPHGFKDATTDPERIREWWSRWPRANIGVPTGESSGLLVIDLDPREGGSVEVLEQSGEVPPTLMAKTGGGGVHLYYRYPEEVTVRNSAGKLAAGVDVRGEGGYVVVPPSYTSGAYEWSQRRELAEPPQWMIEKLTAPAPDRENREGGSRQPQRRHGEIFELPETIPSGERNDRLFRFGCSLRAMGYALAGIEEELRRANRERCSPPISEEESRKIARSAASYPAGGSEEGEGPSAEALEALKEIEAGMWRANWPGTAGKTTRDVMVALIGHARRRGRLIPEGVRVRISMRAVSVAAAVSEVSTRRAIKRLGAAGWIWRDDTERKKNEAGAFILVHPGYSADGSESTGEGRPRRPDRSAGRR